MCSFSMPSESKFKYFLAYFSPLKIKTETKENTGKSISKAITIFAAFVI